MTETTDRDRQPSPWTTLSRLTIYDNPWIRVEDHRVINPSGNQSQYGKVCFKHVAVAIAALDRRGFIQLIGQHRYTLGRYSWELPMGGAALDEAPLAAARRELLEETGFRAGRWQRIMELHTSNSVTDERGIVYLARELTPGRPTPEETEQLAMRALPLATAADWALGGEITDAISVAGILAVAARPLSAWPEATGREV